MEWMDGMDGWTGWNGWMDGWMDLKCKFFVG